MLTNPCPLDRGSPTSGRCWWKTRGGGWGMSRYVSLSLYFGQYAVHPGSGQISSTAIDTQEPHPPWCQIEPWCLTMAPAIAPASGSVSHPGVVMSPCLDHLCVASPSHLVSQLFQYPHKNPLIIMSLCLKGRVPIPGWTLPNTNNILVKGFLAKLLSNIQ